MFEPSDRPRLFGLAPGADFPADLLKGLLERMKNRPPQDLARVELVVNTRRMARRIRGLLDTGPALLVPRIRLLTDLHCAEPVPPAISGIRRRLELIRLISALLDAEPDLAPRAALYDLADSLAKLLDEMQGEKVSLDDIRNLDVTDLSGHWARTQKFLSIVGGLDTDREAPDPEERQRKVVEALIREWEVNPPRHPVLLAGSTGSRGATHLLMQAVARLPQGAVILPGYDFHQPDRIWSQLDDALTAEDHPQYRFRKLMTGLGLEPSEVQDWHPATTGPAQRNRLISLALRPAPVTHQWLEEGPDLGDLIPATEGVTLLKAPSPRAEAMAIALRMREAAETGQTCALITPDRQLTRQVSAALGRWGITPDDSAGIPLQVTPPGRFLRQVAQLLIAPPTAVELLTLLKHPLAHSGTGRGRHLGLTRRLELYLRHKGRPRPTPEDIRAFAATERLQDVAPRWADWICTHAFGAAAPAPEPLDDRVTDHMALAEVLARGCLDETGSGDLWTRDAGEEAQRVMSALVEDAPHGDAFAARDYTDLVGAIISGGEVRNADEPHPGLLVWGTLEARVQGADLVILGGLNEGSWPEAPKPDPWLNRQMRQQAGLLLPERNIGLSAHDFQQAVAAREVWLSRSIRSQDAETVPARWLNRLTNLLSGLPESGPAALKQMEARGNRWLSLARQVETPTPIPPARRPAPRPPMEARPRDFYVTEIERLIRDPYAVYAKKVLRLSSLNPLMREPDVMLRGDVSHLVLEDFVSGVAQGTVPLDAGVFLQMAREVLDRQVPWPETRLLWHARLARVADWFVAHEGARQEEAAEILNERKGTARIEALGVSLSARADRVDRDHHGRLHIFDYKTGKPPSEREQKFFKKQLPLEAAIAELEGFGKTGPMPVARAVYIGLSNPPEEAHAPLEETSPAQVWAEFTQLMERWLDPEQGYLSRRAMREVRFNGDFDHLARFGEWDETDDPDRMDLT
ncbi:double-strand break repair protein AddB [Pseudooceanicola sp. CBS1P-1]|uniref:Double-strand break repair protein AddB n=1 Tax=Pseudooceanicola albus TaxID=2692189 RepID=A0A6L7FY67_9RHOB|nr:MULTISPECIES: double-strand break repair protein AddB [Pseudooceanicola]MBT9385727.1 double-strand break repair protein AddB [Pseudooceanicola endophyticus]MXN16761.1 double-strand break repair protein AddB [Pseudooceanicola albus]